MRQCELNNEELARRKELATSTRSMISKTMEIVAEDETSIMTTYRDFYLQISFSELHPLMVFCLARPIEGRCSAVKRKSNEINLRSVLGSHAVNEDIGCYNYRATHWLDTEMNRKRFFEILDRCCDEAMRGYRELSN